MTAAPASAVRHRQAPFADALVALGDRRPDVVVLSADLARWTDVVPFAEAFPDRFVQVGMAEQNLVGMAAGIAKSGLIPIAVTYAVFATRRAYDQIAMGLCTGPTRAVLVGFLPGITSPYRATHQAIDDLALMQTLPPTTVVDPADATELTAALHAAVEHTSAEARLVYMRALRGSVAQLFSPDDLRFRIGAARVLLDGGDVGLLASGLGTQWALEAAEVLAGRGVKASVLHLPTLKPLDEAAVVSFTDRFSIVTTVENHSVVGGLAAAVASVLAGRGLGTRLRPLGLPAGTWGEHGSIDHVRRTLGLDAEAIAEAVTNP